MEKPDGEIEIEKRKLVENTDNKNKDRNARKKRKQEGTKQGNWEKCMFYVDRKKRYCNQPRNKNSMFCGTHLQDEGIRIPCPLDPAHTIFKKNLDAHILICSAKKSSDEQKARPYYKKNINSGYNARAQDSDTKKFEAADLIEKIRKGYEKNFPTGIETEELRHEGCSSMLESAKKGNMGFARIRHLLQQASIIEHMNRKKLMNLKNVYIEMGAGRGMLGFAIQNVIPNIRLIFVERSSVRNKADKQLNKKSNFERARVDIRDVDMSGLELGDAPVITVAKHLCGVATDITLRGVSQLLENTTKDGSSQASGVVIATCCHHCCMWEDYVNPEFFLEDLGITDEEFDVLKHLTGWACNQDKEDNDDEHKRDTEEEQEEGIDNNGKPSSKEDKDKDIDTEKDTEKEKNKDKQKLIADIIGNNINDRKLFGRQCKRLIDKGRISYLEKIGFETQIIYYCNEEISPENALILAWRKKE